MLCIPIHCCWDDCRWYLLHRDKLKAELDLLQQQGVIAPVQRLHNGVNQMWLPPRKERTELEYV